MAITLEDNEVRAVYLALCRGAQREGEDLIGLFLKTSGSQLVPEGGLIPLLDKLSNGAPGKFYPRYEMIFEGGSHYVPLWRAAAWLDCGLVKAEIGAWVIQREATSVEDVPNVRRRMTDADRAQILEAADQHSAGK